MIPDSPQVEPRLHAVILAAGASDRMGSPKQLLEINGKNFIRRAVDAASAIASGPVTVVLGAHSRVVESGLDGEDAEKVLNADWRGGLASSVRKGLLSVPPAAMAVLLMPTDMPLVDGSVLGRLVNAWSNDRSKIVTCENIRGAGLPAIIPRRYFKALMSIKGDPGINSFFSRHRANSLVLSVPETEFDIDTVQDLERLQKTIKN